MHLTKTQQAALVTYLTVILLAAIQWGEGNLEPQTAAATIAAAIVGTLHTLWPNSLHKK